jgi:NAD(P)-dependent dehydrogenase (short-subunit alcohol dehydrogenase family)
MSASEQPTSGRLAGKVCLVTGGGSGIGRAVAHRFAAEGALVAVADVRRAAADETVRALGERGLALTVDALSTADVEVALDEIVARFGGLDVLVNNAGVLVEGSIVDTTESDWDRAINANLKSVYVVSRAAWPLLAAKGGAIVNTASTGGLRGTLGAAAYSAAKGGVVTLTKCMALDGAKLRIRVNCVCPGFVRTPMIEAAFAQAPDPDEAWRFWTSLHPLGLGEPTDIADSMLYLASDEARWVTGAVFVVDGGYSCGTWRA